jgi:hypothetical protein
MPPGQLSEGDRMPVPADLVSEEIPALACPRAGAVSLLVVHFEARYSWLMGISYPVGPGAILPCDRQDQIPD